MCTQRCKKLCWSNWTRLDIILMAMLTTALGSADSDRSQDRCTTAEIPFVYDSNVPAFGPGMAENPFASQSPESCMRACCSLGPAACTILNWRFSQVSGTMCSLGEGYSMGIRPGQKSDAEWRSVVMSQRELVPAPKHPQKPRPPPPLPIPPRPVARAPSDAKNVLLIVADDMRPDLPMYGNAIVHAPNLQRIARRGVTFNQAHVQFSYCCPSRNSFM